MSPTGPTLGPQIPSSGVIRLMSSRNLRRVFLKRLLLCLHRKVSGRKLTICYQNHPIQPTCLYTYKQDVGLEVRVFLIQG